MLSYDRQVQPKAQAFVWRRPSAFLNISMQYMSSPLDVNIITKMSKTLDDEKSGFVFTFRH